LRYCQDRDRRPANASCRLHFISATRRVDDPTKLDR
jgi:hypothetical protein